MKNGKLIPVCIYCDSTGLFSKEECNTDNLTDMLFPGWIINEWYLINERFFAPECKAEGYEANAYNWYTEIYTVDDTIGLYDFAVAKGYDPVFEIPDKTQNAVVYENLEYDTVIAFKGTTMECRKWAREHDMFIIKYQANNPDDDDLYWTYSEAIDYVENEFPGHWEEFRNKVIQNEVDNTSEDYFTDILDERIRDNEQYEEMWDDEE